MKLRPIFLLGALLLLFSSASSWSAESYPTLYRGDVAEEGPRLLAHFSKSFTQLSPADQIATFTEIEKVLEALRQDDLFHPGPSAKQRLKALYTIIVDRADQIYYAVSGIKLYPSRPREFRLIQRPERCGRTLSVEIETEWITWEPPYEKEEAPPFLDLNRDSDGTLIFRGAFTSLSEFQQTKFHSIRFPADIPEDLKERFSDDIEEDPLDLPSLHHFSALIAGFAPLELILWNELLPKNSVLDFFYKNNGQWKEILFPFENRPEGLYFVKPIARFDLNGNGNMEYLIDLSEGSRRRRLIYEVNQSAGKASIMTGTAPDEIFVRNSKEKLCPGNGEAESLSPRRERP